VRERVTNTRSTPQPNGWITLTHLVSASFHSTDCRGVRAGTHAERTNEQGFKPTSGRIDRIRFQSSPTVWGYFSVGANGAVHEFADSQFGHLFASGATREDARKALILALKELLVRGEIRTAVPELSQV
jgi:acetyl-CoA carboxylase/biotin carboxylase 1